MKGGRFFSSHYALHPRPAALRDPSEPRNATHRAGLAPIGGGWEMKKGRRTTSRWQNLRGLSGQFHPYHAIPSMVYLRAAPVRCDFFAKMFGW